MKVRGRSSSWLAPVLLLAVSLGCGGGEESATSAAEPSAAAPPAAAPAAPPAAVADSAAEAKEIFTTRCVTCHGPQGAGDGPGSAGLTPAPRNFQDPAWQEEVSDEHLANIIQYGGAAVGRSPTMPGNPDLSGKPEVVEALVAYLRGLRSE
jgi:mono/diheme cytochrome c family protein